jgi:hypothetical protein
LVYVHLLLLPIILFSNLEKAELKLIEDELIQFDQNIIDTIYEIITYIEHCVELSLRSNLFHNCIILLRDQWKSLKKYSTMMNIEEILGEKFLQMYSNIIKHFYEYINVFHSSTSTETIKIEHIKKKMHKKYQKKLTMNILREAKAIYDDCALTINIYLQKPVCKRFLLILKTAGFERIKFGKNIYQMKIISRLSYTFFLIGFPFIQNVIDAFVCCEQHRKHEKGLKRLNTTNRF